MGIDLPRGGRQPNRRRRQAKTTNSSLKSLIKIYSFLARRGQANFYKVVCARLQHSRLNRYPISLSRIVRNLKANPKHSQKIAVIVGTVTNDLRLLDLPKVKVCALKFTQKARARIVKAGGQCLTFDQLATQAVNLKEVYLMRGPRSREAKTHFGLAPGQKGSTTAPYVRSVGRKFERGRGR